MPPDETVPRFLWRLAWGGLFAVIAVGLITFLVLAAGAADPPRAGPLVFESTTVQVIPLPDAPYTLEVTGHFGAGVDPAEVWGVELDDNPQPKEIIAPLTPTLSPTQAEGKGAIPKPAITPLESNRNLIPTLIRSNNLVLGVRRSPLSLRLRGGKGPGDRGGVVSILLNGYNFFAVPPLLPDFTPFIHIGPNLESNKITLDVGKDGQSVLRLNDEIAWRGVIPHARSAKVRLSTHAILDRIALYAPESAYPTSIPH